MRFFDLNGLHVQGFFPGMVLLPELEAEQPDPLLQHHLHLLEREPFRFGHEDQGEEKTGHCYAAEQ